MAVITSEGAGGIMARRLLPAAVGVPALLGWLRLAGQRTGLYGTEFGTSLLVASHIVVFTVLIGRNAHSLYRSDIERKRAEEALRRKERELSDFVENAAIGVHCVGSDGAILWANRAELEMLGYGREEYVGHHIADFHADPEVIEDILRRLTAAETLHDYEARLRCKDGSIRHVLIVSNVFREDGRFVHTRCFTRDVTRRKRAEEALRRAHDELEIRVRERTAELAGANEALMVEIAERERNEEALRQSEERFRQLAENIQSVFWIASPTGSELHYMSPAYEVIWGRPCQGVYDRPRSWVEALHPEDRGRVRASFARQVHSGEAWQEEYRIVRPDGSIRWMWDRGFPIRGERGEVQRVVGIAEDITERRRVQEALREAEDRFRLFMDHSPAVGFIKDEDGRLIYANTPFERLCGLRSDDWQGKKDADLWPGEAARRLRENDLAALASGGASEFEEVIPTLGGPRQMRVFKFPFIDSDGRRLLGGMAIDVTDAKRAARKIRRQNRLLRSRLGRIDALRRIDLAIATGPDLRQNLGVVVEQALAQLGVDAADVLLCAPNAQDLECTAEKGFRTNALRQARLPRDQTLAGQIVRERRTVHIADLARAPEHMIRAPQLVEEGFLAYWGVPLVAKGQVLGVLEVFLRAPLDPGAEWLEFLAALAGQAAIAVDNVALFDGFQRSNVELTLAYDATIEGWARALDLRDKETEGHSRRVTEMTMRLAQVMGIDPAQQAHIRRGALLHDVGKLGIPDAILLKPGKLSEEEWEIMRRHPGYAHEWLAPVAFLRPALEIPSCHHERWDGAGYPHGLEGERIPLAARLFAAVDIWDALCSDRPYRKGWPEERVIEHLRSLAGTHLDPAVVAALVPILTSDGERRAVEPDRQGEGPQAELIRVDARRTELATTDDLTGLKDRRHFREALEAAFAFAARQGQPLSLLRLEVDRSRADNDVHAQRASDEVLRRIADVLRQDVRGYDVVGRYGDEEFVVLLPATDAPAAQASAERRRAVIEQVAWPLRPVTVSIGVATMTTATLSVGELVEESDQALDLAKRRGGNRVEHFEGITAEVGLAQQ